MQDILNKLVRFFFCIQLNIKLNHWNTTSYARHKATDQLLDKLGDNIDKFVEVFIGRYQIKPMVDNVKIDPDFINDMGLEKLLLQARKYLEDLSKNIPDSELLNIRDEMLSDINQTLYLLNLK